MRSRSQPTDVGVLVHARSLEGHTSTPRIWRTSNTPFAPLQAGCASYRPSSYIHRQLAHSRSRPRFHPHCSCWERMSQRLHAVWHCSLFAGHDCTRAMALECLKPLPSAARTHSDREPVSSAPLAYMRARACCGPTSRPFYLPTTLLLFLRPARCNILLRRAHSNARRCPLQSAV
jgi:hypothetical protein